ncbi:MAG: DUF4249 domain-containing protein [Marinoscillum sp.]
MGRLINKYLIILCVGFQACVEPIDFDLPQAANQLVIEGMISDGPGPYQVKLSRGIDLNSDTLVTTGVTGAQVELFDDQGNSEQLVEMGNGVYQTTGVIQGEVGRSYHLIIQSGGSTYRSKPDLMTPVGAIEEIKFEYEERTRVEEFGEIRADVFNVYVDANAGEGSNPYIRWRLTGTFRAETYPMFHMTWTPPYSPYKDPFPCSGYIVVEFVPGGKLEKVGECTCCECWGREYPDAPTLSDSELVSNGEFKNVKVGEVAITNYGFHDKYLLEIEQMSMSRAAFDFFKLIRDQKEGSGSIFQPQSGEIIGNFVAENTTDPVIGIFWASSISKKHRYIERSDIPYNLPEITYITLPCADVYKNSTYDKPSLWVD